MDLTAAPPEETVKLAAEAYVERSVRTPSLGKVDRNNFSERRTLYTRKTLHPT